MITGVEGTQTRGNAMKLYRAADSDTFETTASFAACRKDAEVYLANPGFGGRTLWVAEVEPKNVLDLIDSADPLADLLDALGLSELPAHVMAAQTADVAAPQLQSELEDAGYEWVRVRDTYPDDCETWIWVSGDEPEMVEAD